ncbi:response regulator transcription factor [Clostridiaceae bacterium M8S5]|nr:response regulator transcription factor [Clostridiaceae bacterium M8S5]
MSNILVVEDEKRMREIITDYLEVEGYNIYEAGDGQEAIEVFDKNDIDLVILDIMIPKLDGWSICRRIRKKSDVLIIILSARSDEEDKLLGFELGADEYVTKPFSPKVMVARVKSLLSRFSMQDEQGEDEIDLINRGGICINKKAYVVTVNDKEIELTKKEFELLVLLIENEGNTLSRDRIIENVWGYDYFGDGRVVDTNIKTIRKKLGKLSRYITTVIGIGYKFKVV